MLWAPSGGLGSLGCRRIRPREPWVLRVITNSFVRWTAGQCVRPVYHPWAFSRRKADIQAKNRGLHRSSHHQQPIKDQQQPAAASHHHTLPPAHIITQFPLTMLLLPSRLCSITSATVSRGRRRGGGGGRHAGPVQCGVLEARLDLTRLALAACVQTTWHTAQR